MESVFDKNTCDKIIARINNLQSSSPALWGTMDVAQMLAHCNVAYEMVYEEGKHPRPRGLKKFILKKFVKPIVVSDKTYKENGPTSPAFKIADSKIFEEEKLRLIDFITKTQSLGSSYFEGRDSNSFGVLSSKEWNAMFYKHLDHHLRQFGM